MSKCPECHKSFGSDHAMDQHVRDKIHGEGTIPCHVCGRKFHTYQSLAQHEQSGYHERHPKGEHPKGQKKRRGKKKKTPAVSSLPDVFASAMSFSNSGLSARTIPSPSKPLYHGIFTPQSYPVSAIREPVAATSPLQPNQFLDAPGSTAQLNQFIDTHLQPNEAFHQECNQDMHLLAQYLKNESGLDVAEVVQGGSLSKGTAIKHNADMDIVVFLNDFNDVFDFQNKVDRMIETLKSKVEQWASRNSPGWSRVETAGTTPHAVQFRIRKYRNNDFVDVDLLPSVQIDKGGDYRPVYAQMDKMTSKKREYFSGALTKLQRDFVKKQNPNVKNLIRLVKHWKKTQLQGRASGYFPPSYMMELVTIDAWEKAGRPSSFDTRKAFKNIMDILKNYEGINVKWEDNYTQSLYTDAAKKRPGQPFVLDPANPFNNVCNRVDTWGTVSSKARETMDKPLLRDVYASPTWN